MKETYVNPMLQMLLQMEAIIDLLTNGPVPGNEQALPLVLVWFTVIKIYLTITIYCLLLFFLHDTMFSFIVYSLSLCVLSGHPPSSGLGSQK